LFQGNGVFVADVVVATLQDGDDENNYEVSVDAF